MKRTGYGATLILSLTALFCSPGWAENGFAAPPERQEHSQAKEPLPVSVTEKPACAAPKAGPVVTNSIGMKLVLIPAGEFLMGSSEEFIEKEMRSEEVRRENAGVYCSYLIRERPQHKVRITKPFWLAATKVTQEEYERVIGVNPSRFRGDSKRPVEQVSWDDANTFCQKLSELPEEKKAKRRYQLPTEAQWEYACRAGNQDAWHFSRHPGAMIAPEERKLLQEYAWFDANSGGAPHPVAQKKPNPWGLYDMYGNVSEWCQDWYTKYTPAPEVDPVGPPGDDPRVISLDQYRAVRSSSYQMYDCCSRSAFRDLMKPQFRRDHTGFRVSAVVAE